MKKLSVVLMLMMSINAYVQDKKEEMKEDKKETKIESVAQPNELDKLKLELLVSEWQKEDSKMQDMIQLFISTNPQASQQKKLDDAALQAVNKKIDELLKKLNLNKGEVTWNVDEKKFMPKETKK